MALISIGQQVNIQLRTGEWIKNNTILSVAGNVLTIKQSSGADRALNMNNDVVVMEVVGGIQIL